MYGLNTCQKSSLEVGPDCASAIPVLLVSEPTDFTLRSGFVASVAQGSLGYVADPNKSGGVVRLGAYISSPHCRFGVLPGSMGNPLYFTFIGP